MHDARLFLHPPTFVRWSPPDCRHAAANRLGCVLECSPICRARFLAPLRRRRFQPFIFPPFFLLPHFSFTTFFFFFSFSTCCCNDLSCLSVFDLPFLHCFLILYDPVHFKSVSPCVPEASVHARVGVAAELQLGKRAEGGSATGACFAAALSLSLSCWLLSPLCLMVLRDEAPGCFFILWCRLHLWC